MASVRIRHATSDDALAIGTIHVDSWRATYRGMMPDAVLDGLSVDDRVARWRARLSGPTAGQLCHVVEVDAAVAGFSFTGPSRDDGAGPATFEVFAIYLDPSYVGLGHGAALLGEVLREVEGQGAAAVTLWVLESNARARRFYERAGFEPDGAETYDERLQAHELRYRKAQATSRRDRE
jgi:ribosomal protein S18 acetylase RimI-like enzyme